MEFVRRVYGSLLLLFPEKYREEYGEELQAVFNLSLHDAMSTGIREAAKVILFELIGLPKAILYEHLRQRRKAGMNKRQNARFEFPPGSNREALAALTPLLLSILLVSGISMLFSSFTVYPRWLADIFGYASMGVFLILLLVGLVQGLPRWSMPYLGLLLGLFSVYQFSEVIYAYYGRYYIYERSWILGELVNQIYMWSGLTLVVVLLVMATATFPSFHKIRRDWTLLSFLVCGAAPFAILIAFDEYQRKDLYLLMICLVQALGIYSYLHAHGRWKRFLILFIALTLSMWIVAIGRVILLPSQTWTHTLEPGWWKRELLGPVLIWLWLSISMLIPSVISVFPRVRKPAIVEPPAQA